MVKLFLGNPGSRDQADLVWLKCSLMKQGAQFAWDIGDPMHVTLVAITGTIIMVPYLLSQVIATHLKIGHLQIHLIYGCPIFRLVAKMKLHDREPGPWFNIKMPSYQYRKSHCGDKTVVRSSYLHNGISYTGKMSSLYWIGAQVIIKPLILNAP